MKTQDFATSNLSKIRPKLRTSGNVTGNFGRPKVKTNGNNNLGYTSRQSITPITKRSDYCQRMINLYHTTEDNNMRRFAYHELHRLNFFSS